MYSKVGGVMNKHKESLWSALKNEYTLASNGHFRAMLFNIVFVVFEVFYTLGFVMALEEMMSIHKDKSLPAWEKWFSLAMSAVAAVTSFTVGIIIFMVSAPCVMLLITLIGSIMLLFSLSVLEK